MHVRALRRGVAARELDRGVSAQLGQVMALLERRGERIDDFDLAIAAHALAFDATLVTANRKHMARIPSLRVESWSAWARQRNHRAHDAASAVSRRCSSGAA